MDVQNLTWSNMVTTFTTLIYIVKAQSCVL